MKRNGSEPFASDSFNNDAQAILARNNSVILSRNPISRLNSETRVSERILFCLGDEDSSGLMKSQSRSVGVIDEIELFTG